ncbi:7TM diverse intracellular signaling domain-containing protein [Burkholderia plantarii]|uniref:7TM diverse intracellular signaling domain-containing protein n=1 Tax=Burkholderia plantarii TaxID=41899 RepID=UPI000AAF4EDD|nr:7TM diverse intracellular signaling domain-containing protein [Burkholderia plantarii]
MQAASNCDHSSASAADVDVGAEAGFDARTDAADRVRGQAARREIAQASAAAWWLVTVSRAVLPMPVVTVLLIGLTAFLVALLATPADASAHAAADGANPTAEARSDAAEATPPAGALPPVSPSPRSQAASLPASSPVLSAASSPGMSVAASPRATLAAALAATPAPGALVPAALPGSDAQPGTTAGGTPDAPGCPLAVEAARGAWDAATPPAAGWRRVTLPDVWTSRWPGFDGVVWYRLDWSGACGAGAPLAAFIDYLNMAGAVYLNGTMLGRDAQLTEPLSRAWNMPRYWLLPAPLLHAGAHAGNTLLIRVSGLAAYAPGLGPVLVGPPEVVARHYGHSHQIRRDLQLYSLAVTSTLGCFFVVLWLMRRRESVYGWFGLQSLAWWCFQVNQAATTPWPFTSTDGWEAAMSVAVVLFASSFAMFTLRFASRRYARLEAVLWALAAAQTAAMLATPHAAIETVRAVIALIPAATFIGCCGAFIVFSLRRPRADRLALSACMLIFIAACLHDILTFLGVLTDNVYYTSIAAQFEMIGMALVLAWRFVTNLRRIEQFNDELTGAVADAKRDLRDTLDREHALQVANARLNERLSLAQDLHDGLGGTLVSSIITLEHAPHDMPPARFLGILKELRDDLRIIIDSAALDHAGTRSLEGVIAPLRHRLARAFEAQDIDCRWRLDGIDTLHLPNAVCLDLMRILQEAATNALRHSGATRIEIGLAHDDASGLRLTVADNGHGFNPDAPTLHGGIGMRSLRARVGRLGGQLRIDSGAGGTTIAIEIAGLSSD